MVHLNHVSFPRGAQSNGLRPRHLGSVVEGTPAFGSLRLAPSSDLCSKGLNTVCFPACVGQDTDGCLLVFQAADVTRCLGIVRVGGGGR